MVDPNRKINRLTDKDIEFLDECEEEFSNRFTDEDLEFIKHCSQGVPDPPVVQNWGENRPFNRQSHGNGNRRWNKHSQGRNHLYNNDQRNHRDNRNYLPYQRRENWNN